MIAAGLLNYETGVMIMEEKSLGVIGGMGPKATSVFFEKVVDQTVAHCDQDHLNMVVLNHATLPDRTHAILTGTGDEFISAVEKDLRLLEAAGVAHIAIPCNTSHYFLPEIQKITTIPIINMIDETMKTIFEKYGKDTKVGIYATTGTIQTGLYKEASLKYGLNLYTPEQSVQEQVMDIIYNDVKGEMNTDPTKLEKLIYQAVNEHDCQCIILACTELSCIQLSRDAAAYCVDALDVLVERSILLSGKELKNHADGYSLNR